MIATASATIVSTSCVLLKFSLRTSNVPDGDTLVRKRSKPYTKTSDVDSSKAGAVMIRFTLVTWVDA